MKQLYIARHGQAAEANVGMQDFDRPLTAKGQQDAATVAEQLQRNAMQPELIITSTALRAITTANLLANNLGYDPNAIITNSEMYQIDLHGLVQLVQSLDNSKHQVMLVGHNPYLSVLASYFNQNAVENIPAGGIYGLEFAVDDWQAVIADSGKELFFYYP